MILRRIQDFIGGIYDVSIAHDVYDFLVTDRGRLPPCARLHPTDEQLVVGACESGELGVSLYLNPALLERLGHTDPLRSLNRDNVADYWTALEGVSHFVYLAWNCGHDRPVSLLELELQAEIDKYVASVWLLRQQFPQRFPAQILRLLFERTRIDPVLAAGRTGIYRRATLYAERFCRRIEGVLRGRGASTEQQALTELRRFYRLTDARKREHIDRHA